MDRIYLVILLYDAATVTNLIIVVEDNILEVEGVVDDGAGDIEDRTDVHVPHRAPRQGGVRLWGNDQLSDNKEENKKGLTCFKFVPSTDKGFIDKLIYWCLGAKRTTAHCFCQPRIGRGNHKENN